MPRSNPGRFCLKYGRWNMEHRTWNSMFHVRCSMFPPQGLTFPRLLYTVGNRDSKNNPIREVRAMRSFSILTSVFFSCVATVFASCSSGGGNDGPVTGTDPAQVIVNGQNACHATCQRLGDFVAANPVDCNRAISVTLCISNRCDPFLSGRTQACLEAFAASYACSSSTTNGTTVSCNYGSPSISGCVNENSTFGIACP
jgi:hypothetical protein